MPLRYHSILLRGCSALGSRLVGAACRLSGPRAAQVAGVAACPGIACGVKAVVGHDGSMRMVDSCGVGKIFEIVMLFFFLSAASSQNLYRGLVAVLACAIAFG